MLELIISLIITAIVYLLVPSILCFIGYRTKRSYSLKTIRQIAIINGGVLWLISYAIQYNINGETSSNVSAAVIWSFVAYWTMKKILLEKDITPENNDEADNEEKIEFEIVNKKEKNRSFKTPLIVVSILLVLSVALNLYQLGLNNQRDEERIENRDKLDFFDEYIVLVEDDSTNWYHKYDCFRFKGEDFWAFNIDQAEDLGYEPCPFCCK